MDTKKHRPNIVMVVSDTCRTAYLGAYGNNWIHTPNIDRFAGKSMLFTRAHPEALPTIPMRRTLHTGRRIFPCADYRPVPDDNVYLPGWQPMSNEEVALAETIEAAGYHTGFFADTPHYSVPGMNFTRGFRQWEFVRGQCWDRYGATARVDERLFSRYIGHDLVIRSHLANVQPDHPEETWPTARTFRGAIQFVEENAGNQPFYLFVDTFSPHEPWEAPLHYYDLYGSRKDREPMPLTLPYGSINDHPELVDRLPTVKANYAGLVTMVDAWFGRLLETISRAGIGDDTIVIFIADHGTNFADNPDGVMGKPSDFMYPGTMNLPLIVHVPGGASGACSELCQPQDVGATLLELAGAQSRDPIDGQSLLPLLGAGKWSSSGAQHGWQSRDYVTCRYGNSVWYRDDRTWFFSSVHFGEPRVFDLEGDPDCNVNIADRVGDRIAVARERILADAGGELVEHGIGRRATDALGRPLTPRT